MISLLWKFVQHNPTRLLLTTDTGSQATFSCIFQSISCLFPLMNNTFPYMIKAPFSQFDYLENPLTIQSRHFEFLLVIQIEKSLPALQLHFAHHQNHMIANTLLHYISQALNNPYNSIELSPAPTSYGATWWLP